MSRIQLLIVLITLTILFIASPACSMEIQWQTVLGGNGSSTVTSMQKTTNGYILAGSSTSLNRDGNSSIYVAMINETGRLLWNQTYAGDLFSNSNYILPVTNGYLIAGTAGTERYPNGIATVLKIDNDGHELWRQSIVINNSTYSEVNYVLARDDGCVVAGYSEALGMETDPRYKFTMFLAWISNDGVISRVETFPDVFSYRPEAIQDTENGFIIAGIRYTEYEEIYSGFIGKVNNSGGMEWQYQYKPGNYQSYFFDLQKIAGDRYMAVGGYTDKNQTTGAYLVTVNKTGIMLQYNTFPNITGAMVTSLTRDQDSVMLNGWINSQDGSTNLLLAKTWLNGTTIFTREIRKENFDVPGFDIKPDGSGNYVIAGTIAMTSAANVTSKPLTNIYVLKINTTNTTIQNSTPTSNNTPSPSGNNFISVILLLLSMASVVVIKKYGK